MHTPLSYLRSFGPAADPITKLGLGLLAVSILVTVIIAILLLVAIFRDRGNVATDQHNRLPIGRGAGGMSWIYIGVGISTIVLFICAVWTILTISAVAAPAHEPALTLDAIAHQWWWEIRYENNEPSGIFTTANEIHIPVGEPVRINLSTVDVIHSFWIPQLAGKMDLIPGINNTTWIQANKAGDYTGQCAEYCGAQHAHMAFHVIAQTLAEFAAWRQQQVAVAETPRNEQLRQGQDVFINRCSICHTVRGGMRGDTLAGGNLGPDLTHLASRSTIAAGLLPNNAANRSAWIIGAQALKPGCSMPLLQLTTQELTNVVAYLGILK